MKFIEESRKVNWHLFLQEFRKKTLFPKDTLSIIKVIECHIGCNKLIASDMNASISEGNIILPTFMAIQCYANCLLNHQPNKSLEPQKPDHEAGSVIITLHLYPLDFEEFYTSLCTEFQSSLWGGTSKQTKTISSHILTAVTVTTQYHL
jgi:hypothetical protein